MITLKQIDKSCQDCISQYEGFESVSEFSRFVWSTFDALDFELLDTNYKNEITDYFNTIVNKVDFKKINNQFELESLLNVLKLKYIRYLQYSENTIN